MDEEKGKNIVPFSAFGNFLWNVFFDPGSFSFCDRHERFDSCWRCSFCVYSNCNYYATVGFPHMILGDWIKT